MNKTRASQREPPNQSIEPTEGSRCAAIAFVSRWRLPSVAHACRVEFVRTTRIKKPVVTLALLSFRIGSASAVRVVGIDHDWTVHFGDRYYGLASFEAKALSTRIPTLPGDWQKSVLNYPNQSGIRIEGMRG